MANVLTATGRPFIITAFAIATAIRLPTLGNALVENAHSFRETQTAFPALVYAREGIDLLHPSVPVFGPPWTLPFEFPIVQAVAAILIRLGLSVEMAMRGLSATFFLGTAAILWLLLDRHATRRTAVIALLVFLFSPFDLLWSRASLVEYAATFGSLGFVLALFEYRANGRRLWLVLAVVGGSFAALVKITTAVFWLAPSVLTRRITMVLAAVPAAVLALAWTRYADAVKAASPDTAFLTSWSLVSWNFGGDRFSIVTWASAIAPMVLSAGMLLLPFAILVRHRPERLLWAWIAIALLGPLLAFTNLYAIHDYYTAAITPAIASLVGGGLEVVLDTAPRLRALLIALPTFALLLSSPYLVETYSPGDPGGILRAAAAIDDAVPVGRPAITACTDWSPAPFFYANRRGYVLLPSGTPPPGSVLVPGQAGCPSGSAAISSDNPATR